MDQEQHDQAAVAAWQQSSHHNELVTVRCYCGRRAGVVCCTPRGPLFITWAAMIPARATLHFQKQRAGGRVPEQFMPRVTLLRWPGVAEEWPLVTLFCRCHPKFQEGVDVERSALLAKYDEAIKTNHQTKLTVAVPVDRSG